MGERELKYLTLEEAAEFTRVPERTLRKKIADGFLPAYKPSKNILIDMRELEIFMKKSKVLPGV